ncbi:uncharacterized protein M6B38_320850 [Iris pallida]|uniref:Glutaredoxin domain-containing protein n=1 Tax=Iris pallida TaxID=29817 RepID=A0AAX6HCZ4_IRIPA|nr:uncharacterized protein M6B38_320850 [Iris pallida]
MAAAAAKKSSSKSSSKEVILFTTSLRSIRRTYEDCRSLGSLLRALGVFVDERDVSMDASFRRHLQALLPHHPGPWPSRSSSSAAAISAARRRSGSCTRTGGWRRSSRGRRGLRTGATCAGSAVGSGSSRAGSAAGAGRFRGGDGEDQEVSGLQRERTRQVPTLLLLHTMNE